MSAAVPRPARPAAEFRAAELLARCLRAEAGERPLRAIEAVAALVVNRAALAAADPAARLRFAAGLPPGEVDGAALLAAVCRAPFLFACRQPRHPRHALLRTAAEDAVLAICRRVAARALAGTLPDPTGGATHCHDLGELPRWALGEVPLAEIGGLVFYRLAAAGGSPVRAAGPLPGLAGPGAAGARRPGLVRAAGLEPARS